MEMIEVIKLATKLLTEGKSNDEIFAILFNTKGVRVSQIEKVKKLIAA